MQRFSPAPLRGSTFSSCAIIQCGIRKIPFSREKRFLKWRPWRLKFIWDVNWGSVPITYSFCAINKSRLSLSRTIQKERKKSCWKLLRNTPTDKEPVFFQSSQTFHWLFSSCSMAGLWTRERTWCNIADRSRISVSLFFVLFSPLHFYSVKNIYSQSQKECCTLYQRSILFDVFPVAL